MLGAMLGLFFYKPAFKPIRATGFNSLNRISRKNAILIVEFAKTERQNKRTIVNSALKGLQERFRAVLMTAFSFILGVLPMIIATGARAASRISLGPPVFWGMVATTTLGMLIIYLMYVLVETFYEKHIAKK